MPILADQAPEMTRNPTIELNKPVPPSPKYLISELKALDIKDEERSSQKVVEFDIGGVESTKYGNARLTGRLPLLAPYTQPNLANLGEVEEILSEGVRKLRIPWDDEEISGESSNTKVAILSAAYLNPRNSIEEAGMLAMSFFFLCIIYIDDILDKSGSFGGFKGAGDFTAKFLDRAGSVFRGEFSCMEDIPSLIPSLDPVMRLGFVSYDYAVKAIPNFGDKNAEMRKSLGKDGMAGMLMKEAGFGDKYSDETYRMLRARDGGFYTVLEMILLIRGLTIPRRVRKNLLFKVIVDNAAGSLSLVNDLIGLRKEIRDDEVDNLVLRRVAGGKVSLQAAFAEVNELVIKQRADVALASKALAKEYPEEEVVQSFIEVIQTLLDGHFYFSVHGKRYGHIGIKLV